MGDKIVIKRITTVEAHHGKLYQIDLYNESRDEGYRLFCEPDKLLAMLKAAPVRRGRWLPSPDGIEPIRCSECHAPAPLESGQNEYGDLEICRYPSSFCPECGAEMVAEAT